MASAGPNRNPADMRKHRRQPLHYPAWILLRPDHAPLQCMLSDVSNSGAKIAVSDDHELPEEFILILSPGGGTRRNCRVVWREGGRLGVEFFRGKLAVTAAA
ncbi:MAG: PilZ domain-containing protein [Xanthobacteraceae bacterium]